MLVYQRVSPNWFPIFPHVFLAKVPGGPFSIEAAATRSRSSHLGPGAVAPGCLDPTGREDDGPPVEGTEQDSSRRVSESTKTWKTWNICHQFHQHLIFWGNIYWPSTFVKLSKIWGTRIGSVFFWWLNNRSKDFFSAKTRRCTWRMEKNLEDRGTVVVSCSRKPSNQWLDK